MPDSAHTTPKSRFIPNRFSGDISAGDDDTPATSTSSSYDPTPNRSSPHRGSSTLRQSTHGTLSPQNAQQSLKTFPSMGPNEKRFVKRPSSVAQAFNSNPHGDGTSTNRLNRRPSRRVDTETDHLKKDNEPMSCISLDPGSTIPFTAAGSAVFAPRPNHRSSPLSSRANNVLLSSKNKDYDGLVKILLLGDSAVGKSSLLLRFCSGSFEPTHVLTIGVDFKSKIVIGDDNERIKLQIWDTAGQERFRNLTPVYFRTAMGVVLVFDVTNPETFRNISYWMKNLEDMADNRTMRILVGNKIDLPDRQVSRQEAEELAQRYGLKYFETSAKTNEYVDDAFTEIARDIRRHQKDPSLAPILPAVGSVQLTAENAKTGARSPSSKSGHQGFKGFASCCYS